MKNCFKVAVIGGGASGLFSAIELFSGENGLKEQDVVILERLDRVGKKLLSTGNGQCNLSNENLSESNYFGNSDFIKDAVKNIKEIDIKKYLYSFGVPLCATEEGKIYPLSKQASSFLDLIRIFLQDKVSFKYNFFVKNVKKNGNLFEIQSDSESVFAEKVIMAFGGKSAKQFGTDGSSYVILENFGHKTTKLFPSLVQLKTDTEKIKSFEGIREEVFVSVYEGERKIFSTLGDVIFTKYGVSGNAIFKISSYIVGKNNACISLSFLPNVSDEKLKEIISERIKKNFPINKEDLLLGIVNKKIGQSIIKNCKEINEEEIVKKLKNFTLNVKGTLGFDYSQVTRGGIDTGLIDSKTYMSKLVNGLYVVGEALDVDGECGGYNLTFAFSSGITAARDIKKFFWGK